MPLNSGLDAQQLPQDAARGLQRGRVKVITLLAGERLFRFGSTPSSRSEPLLIVSPWWTSEEDYRAIVGLHEEHQGEFMGSLGFTARKAMAVKTPWSRMDVRIKAEVLQDINAFQGLGQAQFEELENGMKIVWDGKPANLRQVYIPNLDRKRSNPSLLYFDGTPALRILTKKIVQSEQPFGPGGK
jgi:hypothetical protein